MSIYRNSIMLAIAVGDDFIWSIEVMHVLFLKKTM